MHVVPLYALDVQKNLHFKSVYEIEFTDQSLVLTSINTTRTLCEFDLRPSQSVD